MRITITHDEAGGLKITIPARRNWPMVIFLSLCVCFWATGEILLPARAIAGILFRQGPFVGRAARDALLFWFPLWTLGGLVELYALLWNLIGQEVVTLSDAAIVVSREVGPFRQTRTYDLAAVRHLRFLPVELNSFRLSASWTSELQAMGVASGAVAFNYGKKTHRFGNGLTEQGAARVIATIQHRYRIPDE